MKESPLKFYFCNQEISLYTDHWYKIKNVFNESDDLSIREEVIKNAYFEIEWELNKEKSFYSYDSKLFKIASLKLLNHLIESSQSNKPSDIIDHMINGLFEVIRICDNHKVVWWCNGNEEDKLFMQEYMVNSFSGSSDHPLPHNRKMESELNDLENQLKKNLNILSQKKIDKKYKKLIHNH